MSLNIYLIRLDFHLERLKNPDKGKLAYTPFRGNTMQLNSYLTLKHVGDVKKGTMFPGKELNF